MPCARWVLTAEEKRSFDAQSRLIADILPTQERLVDLLTAERNAEAHRVLV